MSLQTPREYLVSLGLAKDGRGKFSKEAHEALEKAKASGIVFAEKVAATPKPKKVSLEKPARPEADLAKPVPKGPQPIVRKETVLYVTSPEGYSVGYDMCYRPGCFQTVQRCACANGPLAPSGATVVSKV